MATGPKYDFVMQGSFFAHRALTRDTQMLNSLTNRIDSLSKEQITQLRKWYEFYWNMMEQHHQAEDDILFLELEKRMDQPSEIIEAMEVEHNRLQFLIDEIKRLIGETEREPDSVKTLKPDLTQYTRELLHLFSSHIAGEEKFVYEMMTTHFSPGDQRGIEEKVKRKAPITYLSYMIPWLHDSLTPEEKKRLDRELPWTAKLLNRFFWTEKYNRIAKPLKELI